MTTLTVHWERIGRARNIEPTVLEVDLDDRFSVLQFEEALENVISRHLASGSWSWDINLDAKTVSIDGGRFGGGTLEVA